MKIAVIITMAALTGTSAQAHEKIGESAKQTVTVCMQAGVDLGLRMAQANASKMFAEIGVTLNWRQDQRSCGSGAILIDLAPGTPRDFHAGALAFALPYEGVHIQVFYDRFQRFEARRRPFVLAHVLVHEISHVLQGVKRHSETGIMKAEWDAKDYDQMVWRPLDFTAQDIGLIHRGLGSRTSRTSSIRVMRSRGPLL